MDRRTIEDVNEEYKVLKVMIVQFKLNVEKGTESIMKTRIEKWLDILSQAINLGDGVTISDINIEK